MPTYPLASPHRVLVVVTEAYGVTLPAMASPSRVSNLVAARKAAAWLLREVTVMSLVEISRLMGRHHSTVIYALGSARQEASMNPLYAAHLQALRAKVVA